MEKTNGDTDSPSRVGAADGGSKKHDRGSFGPRDKIDHSIKLLEAAKEKLLYGRRQEGEGAQVDIEEAIGLLKGV